MKDQPIDQTIRSFLIGLGVFLALVPLAPLTVLWVVGERVQGRKGIEFAETYSGNLTVKGLVLVASAVLGLLIWPFVIAELIIGAL